MSHPASGTAHADAPTLEMIVEALKQVMTEHPSVDLMEEDIDEQTPLIDGGLNLDSIVLVELIGAIEERLGFQFPDSDLRMQSFKDLGTLAQLVLRRLQA